MHLLFVNYAVIVDFKPVHPEEGECDDGSDVDHQLRKPVGDLDSAVLDQQSVARLYVIGKKSHVVSLKGDKAIPEQLLLWVEDVRV